IGLLGNGAVIWVTGFKLGRSVNAIWFLNLAVAYFGFSVILPFMGAFRALNSSWPFGLAMCKLVMTSLYFTMFASVLFIVAMSVDRCILVLYPIWSHNHRTPRMASFISAGLWISAIAVTSPYLAFRKTCKEKSGKIVCYVSFTDLPNLDAVEDQTQSNTEVVMHILKLLFVFAIPFLIITISYAIIAVKISSKHLVKSSKVFKVVTVAVASFLVSWVPYSVYSSIFLFRDRVPDVVKQAFLLLETIFHSINCCFTPIFYVLITQRHKGLFRKSLFSLYESAFKDDLHAPSNTSALDTVKRHIKRFSKVVTIHLYIVMCVIGLLGNGIIIWVTGFKMERTANTTWLLNLAVAYFGYSATLPFLGTFRALNFSWPFGLVMCKLIMTLVYFTLLASVLFLVAMSIDRCVIVLCPVWSHNRRTPQMASFVSIGLWVMAFIISSPVLVFQVTCQEANANMSSSRIFCSRRNREMAMYIVKLLFTFVIPFLIITTSYAIIAVNISRKNLLKSSKHFKVIAVAVVSFFVCWAPYSVYSSIYLFHDKMAEAVEHTFFLLAISLQCINCCFTPIFYVLITQGYKGLF
uniref:Probable G-protein coupled receptor 33 n=1 Tax=Latimeria chalumnae TaxID=7897 RepID=H2ZY77_LATCH